MAEQLGVIQFRGKLGNVVGIKKSQTQRANSMRVRLTPSNPRTEAQALQRMKLNTVMKFYRALRPVIERGWESKAYGNPTRLAFLSQVLKASWEEEYFMPYVPKGNTATVPGSFPVSVGSLSIRDTSIYDREEGGLLSDFFSNGGTPSTYGQLWTSMLDAGIGLESGDQVTVITAHDLSGGDYSSFAWQYGSRIVDPTATEAIGEGGIRFGNIRMSIDGTIDEGAAVAAAIVVSRLRSDTAGRSGLRTTSNIHVSAVLQRNWLATREMAIASYMNAASRGEADWEYQDDYANISDVGTETTHTLVASDLTAAASAYAGRIIKVFARNGATTAIAVKVTSTGGRYLVDANGDVISIAGGYLQPDGINPTGALGSLPYVNIGEVDIVEPTEP